MPDEERDAFDETVPVLYIDFDEEGPEEEGAEIFLIRDDILHLPRLEPGSLVLVRDRVDATRLILGRVGKVGMGIRPL